MNQLPISLTLYYPTAAQFEAYLGLMAMLSIAFGILRLIKGYKSTGNILFSFELALLLNPIGVISVVLADNSLKSGVSDAMGWTLFFVAPLIIMMPFII